MGVERKSRGRKIRPSPRRRAAPRTFGLHKRTQTPVVRPVGPERGPLHPAVVLLQPAESNAIRGAFSMGTAGALIKTESARGPGLTRDRCAQIELLAGESIPTQDKRNCRCRDSFTDGRPLLESVKTRVCIVILG